MKQLSTEDATLVCNPENYGFARGCNAGMRHAAARGLKYFWLLNSDTCPESGALGAMLACAEARAGAGAVGSVLVDFDTGAVQEWGGGWLDLRYGTSGVFLGPPHGRSLDYLCGGSLLLRRAALEQVGWLDEGYFMYGEDLDLGLRLRLAGWELAVAERAIVRHRRGASAPSQVRQFYINAAAVRTVRKHAPHPGLAAVTGTMRRCGKSVLVGRWGRAQAILRGAFAGWRCYARGLAYGPIPHGRG